LEICGGKRKSTSQLRFASSEGNRAIRNAKAVTSETELVFAPVTEVARLFRAGKVSPVELTELVLARIKRLNPQLNAYITVTAEEAREQAKRAEKELGGARKAKSRLDRGLLHGIPVSLKDNIYTAGIRTTAGSKILRDFIPERDAPVVTRLKEAGAVLVGKTNMHEFAYGVTNNNPHHGAARNPWDEKRISGGSSGGSAVALAAGLCQVSVGTDTGGSIRIPSSLCGLAGLKTTLGRVDVTDVIPLAPSMDCVGPMARTAEDAAILFRALVGEGKAEKSRASGKRPDVANFSKLRLGLPRQFFFEMNSADVEKLFEKALASLRKLGATVKDVSIPSLLQTESAGNRIGFAEATLYHQQMGWFPERAGEYGEDVRTRLVMGARLAAPEYLRALAERQKFIAQLQQAMDDEAIDALVVPTTPVAAPLIGEEKTRVRDHDHPTRALLLRHNRPANLAGVPAISAPCGLTPAGLPVGLEFIGASNSDELLLTIATIFQNGNPLAKRPNL
jgi:aspartyl-tRNA(Asn)/glutamyl-tRNA(Gln) amidotransferase subunit A